MYPSSKRKRSFFFSFCYRVEVPETIDTGFALFWLAVCKNRVLLKLFDFHMPYTAS